MHEIELTIPQTRFVQCEAKFPLFVAGFGSGKSTTLAVSVFNDLAYPTVDGVNIKIAVYAPTYDLLKLITIPYFEEFLIQMGVGYTLNKSDYIFYLEDGQQIIMRSLDNPSRIVGYQVFRSHIDEIDTIDEKKANDAWNKIIARNRQRIPMIDCQTGEIVYEMGPVYDENGNIVGEEPTQKLALNRVSAYTTPEGYKFAYNRWHENPKEGYVMIRASTRSNIKNLPPDYIQSLYDTYPAELVDAYIEGLFVNLIGKNVYPKFDRHTHDCDTEVQPWDILEVGMDFNVVHGCSAVHVERDGEFHAVDEIHDAYDTDEQIATLKQRYPNHVINVYPDATGNKRTSSNTTESDLAKLKGAGFHVFHDHANPPIKDRVMSFNAMIMNGNREIRYRVNRKKCPNLVNTLEQQIWAITGLPDKAAGLDHMGDAAGYCVFYKFGITKPTATVTISHNAY